MKRRDFIAFVGGAAAWPFAASAQKPTLPVIGFLNGASYDQSAYLVCAFHRGLSETDFVEGRNVAFEYRSADGQYDRLPALAADLVRHQVNVIAATGTPTGLPAKAATTAIPIHGLRTGFERAHHRRFAPPATRSSTRQRANSSSKPGNTV